MKCSLRIVKKPDHALVKHRGKINFFYNQVGLCHILHPNYTVIGGY